MSAPALAEGWAAPVTLGSTPHYYVGGGCLCGVGPPLAAGPFTADVATVLRHTVRLRPCQLCTRRLAIRDAARAAVAAWEGRTR